MKNQKKVTTVGQHEAKTIGVTIYQKNEFNEVTHSVDFEAERVKNVRDVTKQADVQMSAIMQKVRDFLQTIENLKNAKIQCRVFDFRQQFFFKFKGMIEFDTSRMDTTFQSVVKFPVNNHLESCRRMMVIVSEGLKFASKGVDSKLTMKQFSDSVMSGLDLQKAERAAKNEIARNSIKSQLESMSESERLEYEKSRAKQIILNKAKRQSILAAKELGRKEALTLISQN